MRCRRRSGRATGWDPGWARTSAWGQWKHEDAVRLSRAGRAMSSDAGGCEPGGPARAAVDASRSGHPAERWRCASRAGSQPSRRAAARISARSKPAAKLRLQPLGVRASSRGRWKGAGRARVAPRDLRPQKDDGLVGRARTRVRSGAIASRRAQLLLRAKVFGDLTAELAPARPARAGAGARRAGVRRAVDQLVDALPDRLRRLARHHPRSSGPRGELAQLQRTDGFICERWRPARRCRRAARAVPGWEPEAQRPEVAQSPRRRHGLERDFVLPPPQEQDRAEGHGARVPAAPGVEREVHAVVALRDRPRARELQAAGDVTAHTEHGRPRDELGVRVEADTGDVLGENAIAGRIEARGERRLPEVPRRREQHRLAADVDCGRVGGGRRARKQSMAGTPQTVPPAGRRRAYRPTLQTWDRPRTCRSRRPRAGTAGRRRRAALMRRSDRRHSV
jgi:hypothetical protein